MEDENGGQSAGPSKGKQKGSEVSESNGNGITNGVEQPLKGQKMKIDDRSFAASDLDDEIDQSAVVGEDVKIGQDEFVVPAPNPDDMEVVIDCTIEENETESMENGGQENSAIEEVERIADDSFLVSTCIFYLPTFKP